MNAVTHNNTRFEVETVESLRSLGSTISNWRQRRVELFEHPRLGDRLISVGTTFDGKMRVIADEPRSDWQTALEYAADGRVYTSL